MTSGAIVRNGFRTLVGQLSDCDVAVNEAFLHGLLTGCATIPAAKTADVLAAIGGGQPLPGAVRESVLDALDQLETDLSDEIYEARFDPGRSGDAQQWLQGYTRAVEIHEQDWQELNELHTEAAASLLALHTMRDATLHRDLHIDMPGPEELKKHPELVTELVTGIYRRFHESIDDDLESDDDEPVWWLDFSDDELADMDESLLMDIVTSSDDVLPLEVVRECASRGDAMVPLLRQHLENEAHWTEGVDESDWWGLLHAIFILGLIPGEASARTLLNGFRKVNFDERNSLSDWLSGCWPALCRNKRELTTVPLREIAQNRDLGWYARSQAVDCVLADAANSDAAAFEHAVDWLARMCGDDSEDADFRIVAGSTLLDLPRERHRPVMEALADLQAPVLPRDYTRDDIEQAFELGDRPEWERFRDPWQFYDPDEIERRQARWLREAENQERYVPNRRVQTYRRESPKTGRNDPCPCGSGRKYKKCCLGATR